MAKEKLYTKTFTMPNGQRKYVRAKTKAELDKKVAELKAQCNAGIDISDNTTFGEFAQMWVDIYKKPHLSHGSMNDLKYLLNKLVMPTLAPMRLRDIKPLHIATMLSNVSQYSYRSQSKALATAKAILDCAVTNGIIARNPVTPNIKAGGERTKEKTPLTEEQSIRLLTATKGLRVYIPVVLMLGLGLRREEALALMWQDIDWEKHTCHICRTNTFYDCKSRISEDMKSKAANRRVPMPMWVEAALREAHRGSTSLYVASNADGRPMTPGSFNSAWKMIESRTADTPEKLGTAPRNRPHAVRSLDFKVTPHLLRHTCATRWIEQGFNPKEVQYMLGHSSPDITMKLYAHYDEAGRFNETVARMRAL